jgi:hypothetical protein
VRKKLIYFYTDSFTEIEIFVLSLELVLFWFVEDCGGLWSIFFNPPHTFYTDFLPKTTFCGGLEGKMRLVEKNDDIFYIEEVNNLPYPQHPPHWLFLG